MNNYPVDVNTKQTAMYYNRVTYFV